MTDLPQTGTRLAKCVAALQGCSRSQAEALIAAGAVQVDGQVVTDPARRVHGHARVQVLADATAGALTVLLHKPAGVDALQALQLAWATLAPGRLLPATLRQGLPLPQAACGLAVWSDEKTVLRRLQDRDRPLETEWLLTLPEAEAAPLIGRLQALGVRTSLGHSRDGWAQWRLAGKEALLDGAVILDACQWREGCLLRRQRLGRVGLSPLGPGQARWRGDFEKF